MISRRKPWDVNFSLAVASVDAKLGADNLVELLVEIRAGRTGFPSVPVSAAYRKLMEASALLEPLLKLGEDGRGK